MRKQESKNPCGERRIDKMASAKQIAWRKKFAKMAKAGKFRKSKKSKKETRDRYTTYDKEGKATHRFGIKIRPELFPKKNVASSIHQRDRLKGSGFTNREMLSFYKQDFMANSVPELRFKEKMIEKYKRLVGRG